MIYNSSTKIANILENEEATAVFDRCLPGLKKMISANPQALQLSVEQLIRYTRNPKAEEMIVQINEALAPLNEGNKRITESEAAFIEMFAAIAKTEKDRPVREACHHQEVICPGQPWLDTKGDRIQAHGGAVYYENGTYYWYGENKEYNDGKNGIWTWGLKVYASKDLCNWEDLGYLIPPVLDDPDASLFPTKRVDRPHILKCEKTGKYVCWIKLSGPEAAFSIWQADNLLGPYELVEDLYNPDDHKVGDFDMVADPKTGKGYIYFDADHKAMLCMELSEDYLRAEKEVAGSYENLNPPFTREAPALFEYNNKKYMLTSGMTGYVPNKSDSAVSEAWDQPFRSLGDPHINDESCASFNSQISKIFRIEGTDCFIAMADRWLPEHPVDARLADIFTRVIAANYDPSYQANDEERREMYAANRLENANTMIADYVWLPISFEDGKPVINWRDSWAPATGKE